MFLTASSTRKLPVGHILTECDGARIIKIDAAKWTEIFTDGSTDTESWFRPREIGFPAK